jgi:hypothetical protein
MFDSAYFYCCAAKRGFAALRKELIKQLREEEGMQTHYILLCSGRNPPQNWLDAKKETEDKIASYVVQLSLIVGPFKEKNRGTC